MIRKIVILFCINLCSTKIFATAEFIKNILEILENFNTNITRVRTPEEQMLLAGEFAVLDFIGLVEQHDGYTAEEYDVETYDGYILKLHRITGSPFSPKAPGKPVVYIQHGLFLDSDFFVFRGNKQALTFLLADAGYDIWLGNCRGNTYSKRHTNYSAQRNNDKFWSFSLDELALIDLPKFIDVALEKTNQNKLSYIGYSMGTTLNFMLLSEKPEYNDKIKVTIHVAPIAYFTPPYTTFVSALMVFAPPVQALLRFMKFNEIMPQSKLNQIFGRNVCGNDVGQIFCKIFLSGNMDIQSLNYSVVPESFAYIPSGAALQTMVHYYQIIKTGRFAKFDFGVSVNRLRYGSVKPPIYDLSKITSAQALFYGDKDMYLNVANVNKIKNDLRNVVAFVKAPPGYNHLDFMWANSATDKLYPVILKVIADNL